MSADVESRRPPRLRLGRMTGRDPDQPHRSATPLELLFDLTFVVAFGQSADQMAHFLAEGDVRTAIFGFTIAMVAVCWAWVNFSWFASAYDTDDWLFRVLTMLQMIGVLVLALGVPAVFTAVHDGSPLTAQLLAGYVIMRVAMVAQWLRASRQDLTHRSGALAYVGTVSGAQLAWVALYLFRDAPVVVSIAILVTAIVLEFGGPFLAERRATGTPWHAHHLAERFGLLVIIALGEGIFGTIAAVSALVQGSGWSTQAVVIVAAGTGITFAMWWLYFLVPSGSALTAHRERGLPWGYFHIVVFTSIAAVGAGLHTAAYAIEGAHIDTVGVTVAVAAPVAVFTGGLIVLSALLGSRTASAAGSIAVAAFVAVGLASAIVVAGLGASVEVPLLIVMIVPVTLVVVSETFGFRRGNRS